jgi:beta-lactamase class A
MAVTTALQPMESFTDLNEMRLAGFRFTNPLLLSDIPEDRKLQPLKNEISSYIQKNSGSGIFNRASVCFIKLNSEARIAVNENELYNPASLFKVIYLIAYLKMAESDAGLLNKKIFFQGRSAGTYIQHIGEFRLTENRNYTVKELLTYMIMYSDNDATELIMHNINREMFYKVFSDLNLPAPPPGGEYFISIADYAKLFRVLYSSTYLRKENSEYAMELLTRCTFREGICSALDTSAVVAHKFGERTFENMAQLHECAVVYNGKQPYLLGIMTEGSNLQPLKTVLADISGIVFNYVKTN